jgi:hypothetical protein
MEIGDGDRLMKVGRWTFGCIYAGDGNEVRTGDEGCRPKRRSIIDRSTVAVRWRDTGDDQHASATPHTPSPSLKVDQ